MQTGDFVLRKMQAFYDFVHAHPNCTMIDLCAQFCSPASTIRHYTHRLIDGQHLVVTKGARRRSGSDKNTYLAIKGARPTIGLPRRASSVKTSTPAPRDPSIKRKFIKAQQLGMAPYGDLPRAFFGQVGA